MDQTLERIMSRIAEANAHNYRGEGKLTPLLVIAPPQGPLDVVPLESASASIVQQAIAAALLTVTCIEGYMVEQHKSEPLPAPDDIENHPDARRCVVIFAQAATGERACAVQFVLRPEHGRATLSPLKILNGHDIAIADSDLADMTRPGRMSRDKTH